MKNFKALNYFTRFERLLWSCSVIFITAAFILFDRSNYLTLVTSLIGVTFLILNAKGNPLGQLLTIVFSVMYGIISLSFAYYGEMITYMGMSAPIALLALISWIRHPYKGNKAQVEVNTIGKKEIIFIVILDIAVTVAFYFILKAFNTANLIFSTLSVTTSFAAAYLTFRRSRFFSLAYAANDIILIILWTYASFKSTSYISVAVCFIVFLVNDIYGFVSWSAMKHNQQ